MATQAFAALAMTDEIVNGLDLIHMPEVYNKLVGQYPKQNDLGFLKMLGMYEKVAQTDYNWHEENRILDSFAIAAKSTVIANKTVRLTIASGNHYDSGRRSYARVNDRVEFKNGAQGLIIAKSEAVAGAHTVDVQAVSSLYDPVAAAVVGDYVGIMSMGFAEGGQGYTQSIIPQTTRFTNNVQIFREKNSVTTSEMTNKTWIDFTWPEGYPGAGTAGGFYFVKGDGDMYNRFMLHRELGLLTNDINDTDLTIDSAEIRLTRGFIPHVQRYSELLDYSIQPSLGTLQSMCKIINKNHGDQDNVLLMGLNFSLALDVFAIDLVKNGGVLYNSSSGAAMDSVSLGFSVYEMSGFRFHTKQLRALSEAQTTALAGFRYPDLAILCPTGKMKDPKSTTGSMEPPLKIRYKPQVGGGSKDWYQMWSYGAGAQTNQTGEDKKILEIKSEEGMQVFGAKRFIYVSKSA